MYSVYTTVSICPSNHLSVCPSMHVCFVCIQYMHMVYLSSRHQFPLRFHRNSVDYMQEIFKIRFRASYVHIFDYLRLNKWLYIRVSEGYFVAKYKNFLRVHLLCSFWKHFRVLCFYAHSCLIQILHCVCILCMYTVYVSRYYFILYAVCMLCLHTIYSRHTIICLLLISICL